MIMNILKTSKNLSLLAIASFLFISLTSCSKEGKEKVKQNDFASNIESAHKKGLYTKSYATQFDIEIEFGGNEPGLKKEKVRFDAYTWSYFFQFPYKLADQGTIWTDYKSETDEYESKKLSFSAGTGDAPDDWYVIYTNPKTGLINHSAYIVTAHGTKEEAEKHPHAIEYTDYKEINGIPVAHSWTFKNWNKDSGLGSKIGSAKVSNVTFIASEEGLIFDVLEKYQEIH